MSAPGSRPEAEIARLANGGLKYGNGQDAMPDLRAVLAYVADLEGAARLVIDTDGSAGAIAELARSLSQKEEG